MARAPSQRAEATRPTVHAREVGTAEFRANLAKYLKQASAGQPVRVRERDRRAYVLTRLEDEPPPSVFGGMRDRTEYVEGTVLNAKERWSGGEIP